MINTGLRIFRFQIYPNSFGIPKRTIEDWEAGRRKPAEYIEKLIDYKLKHEGLI
jgi:DNA-binding transcriptional regulator YiaG